MLNDLHSDDDLGTDGRKRVRRKEDERPLADREVPLGQPGEKVLAVSVHAWLDGELPEAAVRKGDTARDVEFWNRLTLEVDKRRHLRTPAHLQARIMEALPHTVPQVITPWWRREFVVTPVGALVAGATLVAAAALATAVFLQATH
jgi:hypothetical protein